MIGMQPGMGGMQQALMAGLHWTGRPPATALGLACPSELLGAVPAGLWPLCPCQQPDCGLLRFLQYTM